MSQGAPAQDAAAMLAAFAANTRVEDVPGHVVEGAQLLLLDTLGCLLGGLRYPAVRAVGGALAGREPAGAPFGRLVVLGTAATWLDADSGGSHHPQGARLPPVPTAHPAPHVLPVLLHLAAEQSVADRRLLETFLVATEVGLRVGVASSLRPGLHPHGVHGPGAAALAAGLLHGATEDQLTQALRLGSSLPMAATLALPVAGGTARNLWTGLGAWYGAAAAQWAAAGSRAAPGTWEALLDGAVCTDLSRDLLTADLGRRWEVESSYLKPYACARWIHPTLDAVAAATAGSGLDPGDVHAVEVDTFAFAASLDATEVSSDMHARFSVPWCVATVLVDGGLWAESFLADRLARPETGRLAARVVVREDPAASAALPLERPASVAVHLRDGTVLRAAVRNARGNPSSPLGRDEVEAKFRRNAGDMLPAALTDDIVAGLLDPVLGSASVKAVARHVLPQTGAR